MERNISEKILVEKNIILLLQSLLQGAAHTK